MKKLNLLLLSGICGLLLSCSEGGVQENSLVLFDNAYEYTPCSITLQPAAPSTSKKPDPLIDYQWYLNKSHIHEAWAAYENSEKAKIQIAVVDDALQVDHEDLKDNVISGASINVQVGDGHPNRTYPYPSASTCAKGEGGHGTAVAGIIAAQGDNGRGIKGVASHGNNIEIWGANIIASSSLTGTSVRDVFDHRVEETAVSSNSWGPAQLTRLSIFGAGFNGYIDNGLKNGFYGKGISYAFAAGNERRIQGFEGVPHILDRASYTDILNHPGIMTVCAVGSNDKFASYSEPGPNVWICGYSAAGQLSVFPAGDLAGTPPGSYNNVDNVKPKYLKFRGLPTTDLSGTHGYNKGDDTTLTFSDTICITRTDTSPEVFEFNSPMLTYKGACDNPPKMLEWEAGATTSYTRYFDGTSAATPMVSGVIGLIRSAYPKLTWRDIKLILAESAWQPPASTALATTLKGAPAYSNAEHNYSHSPDYGFGIVNASAAMNLAAIWESDRSLLKKGLQEKKVYPDASFSSSATINVPNNNDISFIEYVQVDIGNSELNFGTLTITLTSPFGAKSIFAVPHQCINIDGDKRTLNVECNDLADGFTFGSAVHLGESPMGDWTLSVTSNSGANAHPVNWKLRLYGH